jgi:hypothetical protein
MMEGEEEYIQYREVNWAQKAAGSNCQLLSSHAPSAAAKMYDNKRITILREE